MDQHQSFVIKPKNGGRSSFKSVAKPCSYAYHLNNHRLARFLKQKAIERRIEVVETTIIGTRCNEQGDLAELRTEDVGGYHSIISSTVQVFVRY
ncbi:MAG: tryptophan 7-halogenase [Candidatus Synoicihabitans palmerolidicus]|nr:tryptophan 7-halogenase [Candidatus Synoicihabitans palmerolidicus]